MESILFVCSIHVKFADGAKGAKKDTYKHTDMCVCRLGELAGMLCMFNDFFRFLFFSVRWPEGNLCNAESLSFKFVKGLWVEFSKDNDIAIEF